MIKTITEILTEVQRPNMSMSVARRHWAEKRLAFNGEQVTHLNQEVEVENGSAFQVGDALFKFDGRWIRHRPLADKVEYHMMLLDHDSQDDDNEAISQDDEAICKVRRDGSGNMLMIGVDGYGEKAANDGHGFPILIEIHDRKLKVRIWGDINQEDPTHCIEMEGARESARETESTH